MQISVFCWDEPISPTKVCWDENKTPTQGNAATSPQNVEFPVPEGSASSEPLGKAVLNMQSMMRTSFSSLVGPNSDTQRSYHSEASGEVSLERRFDSRKHYTGDPSKTDEEVGRTI